MPDPPPADQDLAAARSVFVVVDVTLAAIEHLLLSREGNRRTLFHLPQHGTGEIQAERLVAGAAFAGLRQPRACRREPAPPSAGATAPTAARRPVRLEAQDTALSRR